MKDRIEEFVKKNRNEFDDKVPSEKVWQNIETDMGFEKSGSFWRSKALMRIAAVLVLLLCSWLVFEKTNSNQTPSEREAMIVENGFEEIEAFYTMIIDEKLSEVNKLGPEHQDILLDLKSELHILDSTYLVLKNDLSYGNREQILDAMILNLQMRLEILNQQSEILKKLNNLKENEEFI